MLGCHDGGGLSRGAAFRAPPCVWRGVQGESAGLFLQFDSRCLDGSTVHLTDQEASELLQQLRPLLPKQQLLLPKAPAGHTMRPHDDAQVQALALARAKSRQLAARADLGAQQAHHFSQRPPPRESHRPVRTAPADVCAGPPQEEDDLHERLPDPMPERLPMQPIVERPRKMPRHASGDNPRTWQSHASSLINRLLEDPGTFAWFSAPVNLERWTTYLHHIHPNKPMDLRLVLRKLDAGEYADIGQCTKDVEMIWQNASRFNRPGSPARAAAERAAGMFNALLLDPNPAKRRRPNVGGGSQSSQALWNAFPTEEIPAGGVDQARLQADMANFTAIKKETASLATVADAGPVIKRETSTLLRPFPSSRQHSQTAHEPTSSTIDWPRGQASIGAKQEPQSPCSEAPSDFADTPLDPSVVWGTGDGAGADGNRGSADLDDFEEDFPSGMRGGAGRSKRGRGGGRRGSGGRGGMQQTHPMQQVYNKPAPQVYNKPAPPQVYNKPVPPPSPEPLPLQLEQPQTQMRDVSDNEIRELQSRVDMLHDTELDELIDLLKDDTERDEGSLEESYTLNILNLSPIAKRKLVDFVELCISRDPARMAQDGQQGAAPADGLPLPDPLDNLESTSV